MASVRFRGRPPAETVAYLESRTPNGRLSFDWRDVWQEEHATSFVVAKMGSTDLLGDVHAALVQAAREGGHVDDFVRELRPLLQRKGWWGRQVMTDPLTGKPREVQLGSPRRLRTMFNVNMRMAHAAGAWQGFEATRQALPYLVYIGIERPTQREEHKRWRLIVLPIDHPFWRTHYPPNGWHCGCTVVAMSAFMLTQRGWKVTTEDELEATGWKRSRPWLNRRTGQTLTVPVGIDPGFAYNVGQARRAGLTPPPVPEPARASAIGERWPRALPPEIEPRPLPPGVARRPDIDPADVPAAFARTLGVELGEVFTDRVQMPVVVSEDLFIQKTAAGTVVASKAGKDHRAEWAEALAAAMRDPDEIWITPETTQAGGVRLARRYIAVFDTPDGPIQVVVVFADRDGWRGATTFLPHGKPGQAARYVDRNARLGTLVYRRKG